jgi:hypothetical protein
VNKPRVYFRDGFWRVSKMPRPYNGRALLWRYAYRLADYLNQQEAKANRQRFKESVNSAYGRMVQSQRLQ